MSIHLLNYYCFKKQYNTVFALKFIFLSYSFYMLVHIVILPQMFPFPVANSYTSASILNSFLYPAIIFSTASSWLILRIRLIVQPPKPPPTYLLYSGFVKYSYNDCYTADPHKEFDGVTPLL